VSVLLGRLIASNPDKTLYAATKIPPKNRNGPSRRGSPLADVFPADYIREYAEKSLANLNRQHIDLLQFHVWEDEWADDDRWQRAMDDLKREGLVHAVGISVNRWEPWNGIRTLRTGLVDAVQVIYNIFDQAPEDELFPLCRELDIGVIARVPFDEGSLTGTLTKDSTWPKGDWRRTYFVPENLIPSVERADALKPLVPRGLVAAGHGVALHPRQPRREHDHPGNAKAVAREVQHRGERRAAARAELLATLKQHRWDREPTKWSQ
jgi:aryl-alcohol dehydrogenase-like predicted oxidoreductase